MVKNLKTWCTPRRVGVLCAFVCVAMSGAARADFGSAKISAMGGAGTANPQDGFSATYNPALALKICPSADVGLDILLPQKEVTIWNNTSTPIPSNGRYTSTRGAVYLPSVAYIGRLNRCTAYGITFTPSIYNKVHYELDIPAFGGTSGSHARCEYAVGKLSFHVAGMFEWCNCLGASLDLYGSRFKIDGAGALNTLGSTPGTTVAFGKVTDNGFDYSGGIGFTIGWFKTFERCFHLGASYSHEVHMKKYDRYTGFFPRGNFNLPAIVRAGLAITPDACWTFAFDYEYRFWNRVRSLRNDFPSNGPGGSGDGWGFNWKPQWIVKVGTSYAFNECWTIRLGYRHEKAPVRSNSAGSALNTFFVKTSEDVITSGFTYALDACTDFSLNFDAGLSHSVRGTIPAANGGGSFELREKFYKIGFNFGRKF